MFFTGDASTRKRVDLGGRSSKERDRQKLMDETRLERNRRLWLRQQNSAAATIQRCFRGRKVSEHERSKARESFFHFHGNCVPIDRSNFHPDSEYLRLLFFFINSKIPGDLHVLVDTCRALLGHVKNCGNVMNVFATEEYAQDNTIVEHRIQRLAHNCVEALYFNRDDLKDQLLMTSEQESQPAIALLETIALLIDKKQPWACRVAGYLFLRNPYALFREIILTAKGNAKAQEWTGTFSSIDNVISIFISHAAQKHCSCPSIDETCSFSAQILTIPFLWKILPHSKQVFAIRELNQHYIHQMVSSVKHGTLHKGVSPAFPGYACLLGNFLESVVDVSALPSYTYELGLDVTVVVTRLFEAFPSALFQKKENEDDESPEGLMKVLNADLVQQIYNAIGPPFFIQLTNILLTGSGIINDWSNNYPNNEEMEAIGAVCELLHVTFETFPLERIKTVLAYGTEVVPVLWNFMARCHGNKKWPSIHQMLPHLHVDAPGWLLPLAVFCPVYKHILMIDDNEEFYEQEKPLSMNHIRSLIVILKQALWHLLWVNPVAASASTDKRYSMEFIRHTVSVVSSELLSRLQDWNNRRQFVHPNEFHADGVDENFISQAVIENTRAHDVLKRAPFLVPFTSRVKIFTSQLALARQRNDSHAVFTRHLFRIRRDHILEDAYNQLSALSEEELHGVIRVSFINEFGVEEAGIDGGGIFKDFMESITHAAFDVQYGLFKETVDHMLYPNPGSGMTHDNHLQFFNFLGTVLGKAMFEGILVDIPFTVFFLSKLKDKANYLNDLPSLDPELYRHLLFLKHYEGDISDLELYFVVVNNEYGEQKEEELVPGGRNRRVTSQNVIRFIHLVSNHHLNHQIRQQSLHFLRGFQKLIRRDWIQMFNEHELQLLMSGSLDCLDIDDLRSSTNYSSGYHSGHYVIEMFWEVLKAFSFANQTKFLKFVTGCSRGPLLGFRYLEPLFCIQRAGASAEESVDRLPTSATCMNLLKLPPYRSKAQMESKLLYAINSNAGFDLS